MENGSVAAATEPRDLNICGIFQTENRRKKGGERIQHLGNKTSEQGTLWVQHFFPL